MERSSEDRAWYALIAGALGCDDRGGRVLAELVCLNAAPGAMRAQVELVNEFVRLTDPYSLTGQLKKLAGGNWQLADLNFIFTAARNSHTFKLKLASMRAEVSAEQPLPSPAEICFEEGITRGWEAWYDHLKQIMPPMADGLFPLFQETVQLRLRRDMCARIHHSIQLMKERAAAEGDETYLLRIQHPYQDLIDEIGRQAWAFLSLVEERAAALLYVEEVAEQSAV